MRARGRARRRSSGIPFYRNVKTIGVLLQLLFAAALAFGIYILYNNVTTALSRSNLPSDFGFLGSRAGIPIAETPIPYDTNDSYARALLVGIVNTLRVALVGVVLATLLGIVVGVMRLSNNWLLQRIATVYIEVIRNTPLVVQIVFWFSAVLIPLPPRVLNPIELPGGGYFNNAGLALPWPVATYAFGAWLPWLGASLVGLVVVYVLRKRQLERLDRPGSLWPVALLPALLIAVMGFVVVTATATLPQGITTDFRIDRGRGSVFIDQAGTGRADASDPRVAGALVRVTVSEGSLETFTEDLSESRRMVRSTFRFPPLRDREFSEATVAFVNPEEAEGLSIHFFNYPSSGLVYRDRNGNGVYDPGEEIDPETGTGFTGLPLLLAVSDFERTIVSDRDGTIRIPRFSRADPEDTRSEILPTGPLVMSYPSIPISNYVGGVTLTANYLALLLALVIYTAAFIAEIVRGGIQAVARGQTEASNALGLSGWHTFNLVVFPQALRIIIPPLISQYLNLTKNSSLALFAAYGDFFSISLIVSNQTGAAVPVVLMVIGVYLSISLIFSFILNLVNARLALVER